MCCKLDFPHENHPAPISAPIARLPTQYGGLKRNPDRRLGSKSSMAWAAVAEASGIVPSRSQRSSSVSSEGFCDNDGGRDSDSPHSPIEGRSRGNSLQEEKALYGPACPPLQGDRLHGQPWDDGMRESFQLPVSKPPVGDAPSEAPKPSQEASGNGGESSQENNSNNKQGGVFSTLRKLRDPTEILLARAEGLHAHGHVQEASRLAIRLAEELLANPPNMMHDLVLPNSRPRKRKVIIVLFVLKILKLN